MGDFKGFIAVILIGAATFLFGFGIYNDSYAGTRATTYTDDSKDDWISKTTYQYSHKDVCISTLTEEDGGYSLSCSLYSELDCVRISSNAQDHDLDYHLRCKQKDWSRAAKAMNCLAFICGIIGFVMVLLPKFIGAKIFKLVGAIVTFVAFACGLICVAVVGAKQTKLTSYCIDETDYLDKKGCGYNYNGYQCAYTVFYYSYMLVAVGSLFALLGGIATFFLGSKSGGGESISTNAEQEGGGEAEAEAEAN